MKEARQLADKVWLWLVGGRRRGPILRGNSGSKPLVCEGLLSSEPLLLIYDKEVIDEVLGLVGDVLPTVLRRIGKAALLDLLINGLRSDSSVTQR